VHVFRILIKMADRFFSSSWRILEPCDLDDGYLADLLMRNTEFLRD